MTLEEKKEEEEEEEFVQRSLNQTTEHAARSNLAATELLQQINQTSDHQGPTARSCKEAHVYSC